MSEGRHFETVVIGGGQTGLTVAHELKKAGREFLVVDANERVGDAWRNRWDSLRLFIPARYSGLPGLPLPMSGGAFPTKDQMAEYLDRYAGEMGIDVQLGTRVERLARDGDRYVISTPNETITADNVVVAMANLQDPSVPSFAPDLDPDIVQLHAARYKNPSQLQDGPVLVVGMGNSGADLSLEMAGSHQTYVSGKPSAVIPFRIETWIGRSVLVPIARFIFMRVVNTGNPLGRKIRSKVMGLGAPLVRVKPRDLKDAGVMRVGRVAGVSGGKPLLEDGTTLDVANVIWCTGFAHRFPWVELPVYDDRGFVVHERGAVTGHPGLYFCGLFFLYSMWSENLSGMQPDARHVVRHLVARQAPRRSSMV